MSMRVIVNADDFGLSPAINYGIIEAHRHGVVTSTTAMMNANAIEHAASLSADFPGLGIGLHFVLSFGVPLTAMYSLAREGELGKWIWDTAEQGLLQDGDIAAELYAQYERFIVLFGRQPTHIDSHHHVHFIPQVWRQVERFCREKGLPIRMDGKTTYTSPMPAPVRGPERFNGEFYGQNATIAFFVDALQKAKEEGATSLEMMCHPGFVDNVVRQSHYCEPRLEELEILTSPELKQALLEQGYQLATYRNL